MADGFGSMTCRVETGKSATLIGSARYDASPDKHYQGSPRIEFEVSSGVWRTALEGQSFTAAEMGASTGKVRIGNGMVRLGWATSGLDLVQSIHDGSSWDTSADRFRLAGVTRGQFTFLNAQVIRLTPQLAVLRCQVNPGSGTSTSETTQVDVSLRRGLRTATFRVNSTASDTWKLQFATGTACSTTTGGIVRTAADSNGHKAILLGLRSGTAAGSRDLVNGQIWRSASATSEVFGLGVVHVTGATRDNAVDQWDEWCYRIDESARAVA
jgi:hypothetical protein